MRNKKVKLMKKLIYRTDSPREREYKQLSNGQVVSDLQRTVYQESKKQCKDMSKKEVREYLKKG